jgi:CRISPR-associated protein Cas1
LLNTLYVQTPEAVVRLDHDALVVEIDDHDAMRVPLQHLSGVVLFDRARMTTSAMARCAIDGRSVVHLDYRGHFQYRIEGPASGNVLLRVAQHAASRDASKTLQLARAIVAGKVRNSRAVLMRSARDAHSSNAAAAVAGAADELQRLLEELPTMRTLDEVRGVEGEAARVYFGAFGSMILTPRDEFAFALRTRRPPRDRVNALLSFVYALLAGECIAAAETVGLDPQVGFLHGLRPGRPSLALDLMEELRAGWADRLVLTMINRRQLRPDHFEVLQGMGDSVQLTEAGRRVVLTEYRAKQQRQVRHAYIEKSIPLGLVPQVQARIISRCLRGQIADYVPFTWV